MSLESFADNAKEDHERASDDGQEQHPADKESLCTVIYQPFHDRTASKAIAAQYLAEILLNRFGSGEPAEPNSGLAKLLPAYLTDAIRYATRAQVLPAADL